jgi:hypothetical protein
MPRRILGPGLAALLVLALVPLRPEALPVLRVPQGGGDPVAELVGKLKNQGDTADSKLVQELAGMRTRAALDGLLDAYTAMNTIWMRREVVRALPLFDGVADAEMTALQRLMDVATQASEPELRRAALDGLGQCKSKGKDFLGLIVKSAADDQVREHAMELHVTLADASDHAWYRELYKPKAEEKPDKEKKEKKEKREHKDPKKKGEEAPKGPKKARNLDEIRRMAFEVIRSDLKPEELVEATLDRCDKIRSGALLELELRKDKQTLDLATAALARPTPLDTSNFDPKTYERADARVIAARIVAHISGPKVASDFIKRGTSVDTPMELRRGLADILAGLNDPGVNRELIGEIGRGKEKEKLFFLHAVRGIKDEKVDRALERMLTDREQEVVIAVCKVLAERKDSEAAAQLQRLLGKTGKERPIARAALDALVVVRSGDPKWIDELVAMAKSEDPDVRNLALQALGQTTDKKHLDKLVGALDDKDWSTRLAALDALEHMRAKEAVAAIIARMGKEDGRMLEEFASTLWRLTGQPYQDNPAAWDNWWKQSGANFEFLTEAQLSKVKSSEDEWRLKQATRVESKFFGIRIVSHKVILILDISMSMNEVLETEYQGKSGQTRIEVAKTEMDRCIQGLDPAAFFNVIVFCGDTKRWLDGGLAAASQKNRDEARAFVDKALLGYGTNTYGALKEAFQDPDVDTIFLLSDGEPTTGETDPVVIRDHVAQWNEHRGIVINTIAVGGKYEVLEWLAEDSGGTHVKYE